MSETQSFRARVFYHWKKPEAKERHGFSMGMVEVSEKSEPAVLAALKEKHAKLRDFVLVIDKLEWR